MKEHYTDPKTINTDIIGVTKPTYVKTLFSKSADEYVNNKVYNLVRYRELVDDLVHHLIKSFIFAEPVSCLINQQV